MKITDGITFDDVLLVPQASNVSPTKTDTHVSLGKIKLGIPLLSAAMDTVTESMMAICLGRAGGLGGIYKNMVAANQIAEGQKVKAKKIVCAAAISIGPDAVKRGQSLIAAGADAIVIDVAHGHYYKVAQTVRELKKSNGKKVVIIAGNVATAKATADLIKAGADVVKVGVGPGSICTTRVVAGVGVPQLTAIIEAAKAAKKTKTPIIADGGIKYSGDIVKALSAGATAVMVGGLLAGTDEAPGKIITENGKKYKIYRGMGSLEAMQKGSADRYLQADKPTQKEIIAEGVVGRVAYKGPAAHIIAQLIGGLQQGMGYCGAATIAQLHQRAEFVRITGAGLKESHPHSLQKIQNAPNYSGDFV